MRLMAWSRLGQVEVDAIVQLRDIRLARCWPWSMLSANGTASAASAPACSVTARIDTPVPAIHLKLLPFPT
jgi:hypothetical protein